MGRLLPNGSWAAVRIGDEIASLEIDRVAVSIFGAYWQGMGCSTITPTIGPVVLSTGFSSVPGAWYWDCWTESGEISFDGGSTWQDVNVTVCVQHPAEE
jgi:hypothetical protein